MESCIDLNLGGVIFVLELLGRYLKLMINKYFKMFPNIITPIDTPNARGKRNLKFSFIFLKKLNIQFIIFS